MVTAWVDLTVIPTNNYVKARIYYTHIYISFWMCNEFALIMSTFTWTAIILLLKIILSWLCGLLTEIF